MNFSMSPEPRWRQWSAARQWRWLPSFGCGARLHAIPDPTTLHRHLAEIDVFEVFNARLLRDSFNDEALRFAQKYRLLQGAGSDAHVLQGVGTGAVRMRRFEGPEEFLLSLRTAEILRRPKSLAYLQSLKWVAQVKEKVR